MRTCPTCRVPLGPTSLIRNIPMEKLAKTYFDRCTTTTSNTGTSNTRSASRNTELSGPSLSNQSSR